MTNRYMPNETACPVPVDLLAQLLRSNEVRVAEIAQSLPMTQRAKLATFCYARTHMRSLGFQIAIQCDEKSLRTVAGLTGEAILEQSRNRLSFDLGPKPVVKRAVTLARSAA